MKFYLINPSFPDTFWGFRNVADISGCRYATANLALPTIAAMIPPEHDIEICDENTETINFNSDADIIGITGFNIQAPRMFEIAEVFRAKGKIVVIGGPYASLCPDECQPHCDILISGEAERIFPQFLSDLDNGKCQERYDENDKVDITTTPLPRWDLMNLSHYGRIPLQTTRGCPFNCEFCDVIVYLGRKVRQKTPDQIANEIDALYPHMWKAGRDSIFFADDNFIGNKKHARETCKHLIELNKQYKRPFRFSTQVTINLAKDEELMELMAEAGFHSLFFGIETPNKNNLLEANKVQNTKGDLIQDIKKIQSYGIFVWAGMIVGFDNDKTDVFKEQLDFINESNIILSMTGMLNAPANTPLWTRLQKEGRLIEGHQYTDQADTNIIPGSMSVDELKSGYVKLLRELYSYENYSKRLIGSLNEIKYTPTQRKKGKSLRHIGYNMTRLARILKYYLLTTDSKRRHFFTHTLGHILKSNPHYIKEAIWHLAAHKHFYEYSKILENSVDRNLKQNRSIANVA